MEDEEIDWSLVDEFPDEIGGEEDEIDEFPKEIFGKEPSPEQKRREEEELRKRMEKAQKKMMKKYRRWKRRMAISDAFDTFVYYLVKGIWLFLPRFTALTFAIFLGAVLYYAGSFSWSAVKDLFALHLTKASFVLAVWIVPFILYIVYLIRSFIPSQLIDIEDTYLRDVYFYVFAFIYFYILFGIGAIWHKNMVLAMVYMADPYGYFISTGWFMEGLLVVTYIYVYWFILITIWVGGILANMVHYPENTTIVIPSDNSED